MASERSSSSSFFSTLPVVLLALACGSAPRYPLRAPLAVDTDRRAVHVSCETRPTDDDPEHVACAPEPYVSPLAWDAADNSIFRPLARVFAVDPADEAENVNALDEVPDSAWFQNRMGRTRPSREALLRGACAPEEMLDPSGAAPGSWLIDKGKPNGASAGFRIKVGGKRKYMMKTDTKEQPERPSAASVIGAAIYHAVGFNTSCEQIVYLEPKILTLAPGLTVTDNSNITRPFDRTALAGVLAQASPRGERVRMQASAWLPGHLIGPFRYEGTRSDDPNDVIPHEDRRDLRGGRLVAAWLNHFDAREQNTMDTWIASDPQIPDSSPGFVRHYYLDTSDSFGSEWADDGISRRLGRSYLLDFEDIGTDFVTFGTRTRPWEEARRTPGMEPFGYYHHRDFAPEAWKNEYPNPAFSRATEHDNAWMARILSRFDRADIDALVTLGDFTRPEHTAFLAEVLEMRLRKILERYLSVLSPLSDARVERGGVLALTDLAARRAVRSSRPYAYRVQAEDDAGRRTATVRAGARGEVRVTLRHRAFTASVPPADPSRYVVVTVDNGAAKYPLKVHLYDLGVERGFRLVGLERPTEAFSAMTAAGDAR
jgi:hypothetical protein